MVFAVFPKKLMGKVKKPQAGTKLSVEEMPWAPGKDTFGGIFSEEVAKEQKNSVSLSNVCLRKFSKG